MTMTSDDLDHPPFDPYDDTGAGGGSSSSNGTRPPDLAAEMAVLGAMLLNPTKTIPQVSAILRGSDYQDPRHETLHHTLQTLHTLNTPIDPVTVANHLQQQPHPTRRGHTALEHIGGPLYLHELTEACPVPASATHYADTVRIAARRRLITNTGIRLTQTGRTGAPDDLDTAFTQAYETLDKAAGDFGPTTHQPTTWTPVDLTPVLAGDYLDPPPTILHRTDSQALLYDGMVHSLAAEPGSGKTWLTLLAAHELITNREHVTFIDFEDRADRVIARLLALGAHPDHIHHYFHYIRPDRPLDDAGRTQLQPPIQQSRLVIIDGVTEAMTMHGLDLNSNEDAARFLLLLPRWCADHGPAVITIDHLPKDKEKQGRFALGAQHKLAGVTCAYILKTITPFGRGRRGIAQILLSKDRPGHVQEHAYGKVVAEFALDGQYHDTTVIPELTPPGRISGVTDTGKPFEPTHLMEKISAYVATNPGLSKKSIEGVMNGKAATVRLALELLVTRGYITTTAGARGAIHHHSHHPYYADQDPDSPDYNTTQTNTEDTPGDTQ